MRVLPEPWGSLLGPEIVGCLRIENTWLRAWHQRSHCFVVLNRYGRQPVFSSLRSWCFARWLLRGHPDVARSPEPKEAHSLLWVLIIYIHTPYCSHAWCLQRGILPQTELLTGWDCIVSMLLRSKRKLASLPWKESLWFLVLFLEAQWEKCLLQSWWACHSFWNTGEYRINAWPEY